MRYKELIEAPLADFDVYGDRENAGSFNASEVKAMNNKVWLEKLNSHFSRTPYKINVYFYNAPNGDFTDYGKSIRQAYDGRIKTEDLPYFEKTLGVMIPHSKDAITFVMLDNEGDEKIGLTPWIVAHRLVHSLVINRASIEIGVVRDFVNGILQSNFDATKIFKFKSAQHGNIARTGEYIIEIFTQYIVQGKITINLPEIEYPIRDGKLYDQYNEIVPIKKETVAAYLLNAYIELDKANLKYDISHRAIKKAREAWLNAYPSKKRTFDQNADREMYHIKKIFEKYNETMRRIKAIKEDLISANTAADELLSSSVGKIFCVSGRS